MQLLSSSDPISSDVWEIISRAMQQESKTTFMSSRTSVEVLSGIFAAGQAVLGCAQGDPIAFIAAWPAPDGFLEIGAAWIRSDHRNRGLGKALISQLVEQLGERVSFAITTNPAFIAAAQHAGMKLHHNWQRPITWAATCGPCDWIGEEEKPSCPKRNGACRLLVSSCTTL